MRIAEPSRGRTARRVLAAGLTVAVLDFSYVTVLWVVIQKKLTLMQMAQAIATGLMGRAAYEGGAPAAALGIATHVTVALAWTMVFLLVTRRVGWCRRLVGSLKGRIVAGLCFGPIVWVVMDLVVLPLSRARPTALSSPYFYVNLVQHALMVGLPMALVLGAPDGAPEQSS